MDNIFEEQIVPKSAFIQSAILSSVKKLIYEFEFFKATRGHSFVGVPEPLNIIQILEDIIDDESLGFGQGDKTRITTWIKHIEDHTQIAYSQGKKKATSLWEQADTSQRAAYEQYNAEKFQSLAKNFVPEKLSRVEGNWYIEGFCRQWTMEWMKIMYQNITND